MPLEDLYQQAILAHNRAPLNCRVLAAATHRARGLDALCGDDLVVELVLDGQNRILEAAWTGEACAVTTASVSMLTDWLPGRVAEDVRQAARRFRDLLKNSDLQDCKDLNEINSLRSVSNFPSRLRNAWLPWQTVLDALGEAGGAELEKDRGER